MAEETEFETTARLFQYFDQNADGCISRSELLSVLHNLDARTWTESRVDRILAAADLDHDCVLSCEEFAAWLAKEGEEQQNIRRIDTRIPELAINKLTRTLSNMSSDAGKDNLVAPLQALHDAAWEEKEPAINLLLKLLQNVVAAPENPKFRHIKRTNATLQAKLFSVHGCAELLLAAGFEEDGEELVLPEGIDVQWVVDELTLFGNQELMAQRRAERDQKIAAVRAAEGKTIQTKVHVSSTDPEERRRILQQAEYDRQERAAKQKLAAEGHVDMDVTQADKGVGLPFGVKVISRQVPKKKSKKGMKEKKALGGRGSGHGGFGGKGHTLGRRGCAEIPIPCSEGLTRDTNAAAARARAAEARMNKIGTQRNVELEAIAKYKSTRSQKLARECQEQEAIRTTLAHQAAVAALEAPPIEFPSLPVAGAAFDMERHKVPGDNSCLFHAVAYLTRCREDSTPVAPGRLRQLIAARMSHEPERWNEVTLAEKGTVDAYVAWISHPDSWGGFVDLIVLSECFEVQFSVMSTESLYWTHYPDDAQQYKHRVYLLYNGIHYDAVVGRSSEGEIRFFCPVDNVTMKKVADLAGHLQVQSGMQEIRSFTCLSCGLTLAGEAELARHSFETKHHDYEEMTLDNDDASDENSGDDGGNDNDDWRKAYNAQ